jgi:hypothetical protein
MDRATKSNATKSGLQLARELIRLLDGLPIEDAKNAFLAEHLDGRYEPMDGEKIPGSSAVVKTI